MAESFGTSAATSGGTTLTSNVTAHTKGAYAQLIASTSAQYDGLLLVAQAPSAAGLFLIDLATGGAGAESVLLADWKVATPGAGLPPTPMLWLPLTIASGSRIAARCQDSVGGATIEVSGVGFTGGFLQTITYQRATTYGANTADSTGVALPSAGSTNSKTAWQEIVASTAQAIDALVVLVSKSSTSNTFQHNSFLLDVGTGGAGSETVVIPDIPVRSDSNSDNYQPGALGPFPVSIAAGTRIAIRQQYSVQDPQSRSPDITLIGLDNQVAGASGGLLTHPGMTGGCRG